MTSMRWSLLGLVLLACGGTSGRPVASATAPPAQPPRVVLISLDGFRADYLDRPAAVRLRARAEVRHLSTSAASRFFELSAPIFSALTDTFHHHATEKHKQCDAIETCQLFCDRSEVEMVVNRRRR